MDGHQEAGAGNGMDRFLREFVRGDSLVTEERTVEATCHYCQLPVFIAADTPQKPLCASCWERLTVALARAARLGFHLGT